MKIEIEIPESLIKVCKQCGLDDQNTIDFIKYYVTQPELIKMMKRNIKGASKMFKNR